MKGLKGLEETIARDPLDRGQFSHPHVFPSAVPFPYVKLR